MSHPNPWKYVQAPDVSRNPYVNPPAPGTAPAVGAAGGTSPTGAGAGTATGSTSLDGAYILMDTKSTYALALDTLREACRQEGNTTHPLQGLSFFSGSRLYRPLTFRENIEARVREYQRTHNDDSSPRTEEQKLHLFSQWLDSCMGIAYKKDSTKFTLIPECQELITIAPSFNDAFMPISYRSVRGIELNSTARGVTYNNHITQSQVVRHPAWKAAVGDDALLREYAGIVFSLLQRKYNLDKGMGFFVVQNPEKDQLRALFVRSLDSNSNAIGFYDLNYDGSFLRVAHRGAPAGRAP